MNPRKRRASELDNASSGSSNMGGFSFEQPGFMGGEGGGLGLGGGGGGGPPGGMSAVAASPTMASGGPHAAGSAGLGVAPGLGPAGAAGLTSPPVAKKGRTNTPWTPAEEQRLKQMRDAGNSWSEIAKTFPARTEGSVKKHWYKVGICLTLFRRFRFVHLYRAAHLLPLLPPLLPPLSSARTHTEMKGTANHLRQDMHYAEFAEDEVSNFVRLNTHSNLCMLLTNTTECRAARRDQRLRSQ